MQVKLPNGKTTNLQEVSDTGWVEISSSLFQTGYSARTESTYKNRYRTINGVCYVQLNFLMTTQKYSSDTKSVIKNGPWPHPTQTVYTIINASNVTWGRAYLSSGGEAALEWIKSDNRTDFTNCWVQALFTYPVN